MAEIPHDMTDLRLAPLALELDARLEELARLPERDLAFAIALEANLPDHDRELRELSLLRTLGQLVDTRGWQLALDERGLRVSHGKHTLVLGLPDKLRAYVDRTEPELVLAG